MQIYFQSDEDIRYKSECQQAKFQGCFRVDDAYPNLPIGEGDRCQAICMWKINKTFAM